MDFSFLDSDPHPTRNNRQQPQPQSGAANPTAGATASGGGNAQQQQQQQPRVRIQLPSFRQVQAAQAPVRPINTFQRGRINSSQPQQPQQQHAGAQQPAASSQPAAAAAAAAAGPSAGPAPAAAAGAPGIAPPAAAAAAPQQPSWSASLPPMSLAAQLPRFSQAASGATTGAAVGISRPTVPLPAAAAAAGGASSQQGAGQQQQVAGIPAQQQQQEQVPLNAVLVSRRQQGNPVLKHIRAVRWVFADIVPDYLCGPNTAVLFLSLRYHLLQPEYILSRLQALQRAYRLAVLLLLVDAEEVVKPLQELHRAALGAQATLVCAWSNEECARYIETFKAYENRPASSIMEHTDTDYMGRLASALTSIRGINRSDAYSMARHFGTLADALKCDNVQGFVSIPGLGPVKAKRLLDTFHQPFKRSLTATTAAAAPPGTAAAAAAAAGPVPAVGGGVMQLQGSAGGSQAAEEWEDEELLDAAAELEAEAEAGAGLEGTDMDVGGDEGFADGDEGAGEDEGEGEGNAQGGIEGYHQDYLEYGSEDGPDA